jgi:heptosyltransferase-1
LERHGGWVNVSQMRVLIVRLSSMGDLVQTLPALSDAARALPDIRFDWAVDESFAQVPAWHEHVDKVFPSAFRRWRKALGQGVSSGELSSFIKRLRAERYDQIVDVQGEWKSATICRLARGPRRGYDGPSVHEWGAHLTYRDRFPVAKGQHSIARMRQLLSQALGYTYDEAELHYGIDRARLPVVAQSFPEPYVVFVHSTSWESKNWPEQYWRQLSDLAVAAGFHVVLPWGSEAEQERSRRIAAGRETVSVLPPLSIAEKASIIERAAATVGLDTGLSHIAAALDVPSVTIYGATDPALVGATGKHQVHVVSDFECVKCHEVRCGYEKAVEFKPACFVGVTPERVWREVKSLVTR